MSEREIDGMRGADRTGISYFSVSVLKHQEQKQFKEERVYFGLQFPRDRIHSGKEAEIALYLHTGSREKTGTGFITLPDSPVCLLRTRYSDTQTRQSSFNPPQRVEKNTHVA